MPAEADPEEVPAQHAQQNGHPTAKAAAVSLSGARDAAVAALAAAVAALAAAVEALAAVESATAASATLVDAAVAGRKKELLLRTPTTPRKSPAP